MSESRLENEHSHPPAETLKVALSKASKETQGWKVKTLKEIVQLPLKEACVCYFLYQDESLRRPFASASHQHIVKLADDSLWRRSFSHTSHHPLPPSIPLTHTRAHTHTHVDRFSLENSSAHEQPVLTAIHSGSPCLGAQMATPPLPLPSLSSSSYSNLLLQCKSLMMMCCRGNGWRWAAPRAVGGSQPLSSVGGICWAHPSPSFWKEQEADCFWEGVGVGELSPLLPAASLGIALFVSLPSFLCFLVYCCMRWKYSCSRGISAEKIQLWELLLVWNTADAWRKRKDGKLRDKISQICLKDKVDMALLRHARVVFTLIRVSNHVRWLCVSTGF